MRSSEILAGFPIYRAKVRIKNPNYSIITDVTVSAKNRDMARRILRAQFGANSLISNVTEVK